MLSVENSYDRSVACKRLYSKLSNYEYTEVQYEYVFKIEQLYGSVVRIVLQKRVSSTKVKTDSEWLLDSDVRFSEYAYVCEVLETHVEEQRHQRVMWSGVVLVSTPKCIRLSSWDDRLTSEKSVDYG